MIHHSNEVNGFEEYIVFVLEYIVPLHPSWTLSTSDQKGGIVPNLDKAFKIDNLFGRQIPFHSAKLFPENANNVPAMASTSYTTTHRGL